MSAEDEVWEGIAEDGPLEQAESVSGEAEVDLLEERPFDGKSKLSFLFK